jgi:tricorn protease
MTWLKRGAKWWMLAALLLVASGWAQAPAPPAPSLSEPGISSDGTQIAFVSGSRIWIAPARGGAAHLAVDESATEQRPLFSPDGARLAFESTRTGHGDIYVLTLATGRLERLTWDDGADQLDAWSRDGRWIYFHTSSHDISGMSDVYRVSASGGTPMPVAADRYENEFFAAPSPDGKTVAISARGIASSQWWRKGRSHLDEAEIWLVHPGEPPRYERATPMGAKQLWPMWSADGKRLFFVSDRNGPQNIWEKPLGGTARQVTRFRDGRVLWPTITGDGRTIVFERHFHIWRLDTPSGKAAPLPIQLVGGVAGPPLEHLSLTRDFRDLALSPDGKKAAWVARGQIFAASAKDGGDAARVTTSRGENSEIAWAPDSRRIAYSSDRDGTAHLFLYDFVAQKETALTSAAQPDSQPRFSPDGKELAFIRDGKELRVLNLATHQQRVVATARLARPPLGSPRAFAWSPDGKWLAYLASGERGFRNAYVAPAAGGDSRAVSFLPNAFSGSLEWSPDGTFLMFTTTQRTEPGEVARVDLVPRTPKFREQQFRELFEEKPPAARRGGAAAEAARAAEEKKKVKPVQIVFEDIRRRVSLLPVGMDIDEQVLSPDGKTVLLLGTTAGQQNLYTWSIDPLAKRPPVARQLTATPGRKADPQFSPDGKVVFYLEQGQIRAVSVASRQAKPLAVTAEMALNFPAEKQEMFDQAWTYLRDDYVDPKMNGVDWNAVRAEYEPQIEGARTGDEVRRLLLLMIGELNSSHSGVSAPRDGGPRFWTGRLGLAWDPAEYEASWRLRITHVVALGPAALTGKIHAADYLLAVDGRKIGAHTNLASLLDHKVGKETALEIAPNADGAGAQTVAVQPVDQPAMKHLLYREWVERERAYVEKISGGKLGYVHMPDMSGDSLRQFYLDLDTQNQSREGVVIDIRNNNGGFVNVYAIDVLARRPYLTMTVRGYPPAPARSLLGQRALERPTVLVTNQHSLSDSEDFTEGYRALHLGKVVGEPTAGWIIYTSGAPLIDGSFLRIPFIRITTHDGKPMEMHPRPVDVPVALPLGSSYSGKDVQLETAVRVLLRQIAAEKK